MQRVEGRRLWFRNKGNLVGRNIGLYGSPQSPILGLVRPYGRDSEDEPGAHAFRSLAKPAKQHLPDSVDQLSQVFSYDLDSVLLGFAQEKFCRRGWRVFHCLAFIKQQLDPPEGLGEWANLITPAEVVAFVGYNGGHLH